MYLISKRFRRISMRVISLFVSIAVAASYIACIAPWASVDSHRSACHSIVLYRDSTGSGSTHMVLELTDGTLRGGLNGTGFSIISNTSASFGCGPEPYRGWLVGKFTRSVLLPDITGSAKSSASWISVSTDSTFLPDLLV